MALFNINGVEADTMSDAFDIIREIHSQSKQATVMEQKRQALSKPSALDLERAAVGATPDVSGEAAIVLRQKLAAGAIAEVDMPPASSSGGTPA